MRRACEIRTAGSWNAATAIDRVVLDAHERHRRRIALTGEGGTAFLLDLPQATPLKDGDGLVLEDGAIVRVAGKAEPLLEIAAASPHELARLAWHIGNRHAEVQVVGDTLRSGATPCWKTCCAASARGSRRSRRHSTRSMVLMDTQAT